MNKFQESEVLTAKQLINYANLKVEKKTYVDENDELRFRIVRPGCPLSEKKLREEMSDLCRALIRHSKISFDAKQRIRRSLDYFKAAQLKVLLQDIISSK